MNPITPTVEATLRKDFRQLGREIERPESGGWGHHSHHKNFEEVGELIGDIVVTILKVITGTKGKTTQVVLTAGTPRHK